jgi:serine phosphatase RsbU (regulator of sigma subunit)
VPPPRYLVLWALGWAVIGALVAVGITFMTHRLDLAPVLLVSVQFAEVVGFTALLSARVVFPLFTRLPESLSFILQVMVLFSATVAGSTAILASWPLFSLAQLRSMAMIVVVNAVLAVVVGISLHVYDTMRHQIEASYRTLREKEAMEREIEIAREVQRELLPRAFPIVRGLQLAGACHPAIGVGGDYYDFLPFAEDQIGLVIADVSGKGIPAALLMAGLQASVRSLAMPAMPPSEVNRRLNETMLRSTSAARYATLFYGVYDGRERTLVYSNAGHYPPIHLGADGVARLMADGYPIGLLSQATYTEGRRQLRPGDLLMLYTDGIIEAPDQADREYGETRLIDLLKAHRHLELDAIVFKVFEDLERWTGGAPPHDDATLVLGRAT